MKLFLRNVFTIRRCSPALIPYVTGMLIESYCNRFTPSNIFKNKHGKEPYPGASRLLCLSLNKFDVKNKHVAVIGSHTPWIEAILINLK